MPMDNILRNMVGFLGFMRAEPRVGLNDPRSSFPTEATPSFSLSPSHTPPYPKMAPAPHCRPLRARNPHGSRSAQRAFLTQTQTFPSKYKPVYNFGSADFLLPATRVTSRAVLPQNHFLTGKLLPSAAAAGERGTRECARRRRKKRRFYLEVQV